MNVTLKRTLTIVIVAAVFGGLGYSLYITYQSGATRGIVSTCGDQHPGELCWFGHVHAYVPISICGEYYRLGTEVAPLNGPHTHEEKNIVHWHGDGGLLYSTSTQEILETQPLTLGAFFDAMEVPFSSTMVADTKNGDLCPQGNLPGIVSVFVNGAALTTPPRDYIWEDRDVIQIFFDPRSIEELKTYIDANPVEFPKLGRG
jgi:hypothetical protein